MPPRVFGRGRSVQSWVILAHVCVRALSLPLSVSLSRVPRTRSCHLPVFRSLTPSSSASQRQRGDGDFGRRGGGEALCCPQGLLPGSRSHSRSVSRPPPPPLLPLCTSGNLHAGPRPRMCYLTRTSSLELPAYPHRPPGCAPGQDEYIQYFVARPANRPPLINRGHYSRVASIRKMISQFLVASRLQGVCVCERERESETEKE